jgi:hypothetical protein
MVHVDYLLKPKGNNAQHYRAILIAFNGVNVCCCTMTEVHRL